MGITNLETLVSHGNIKGRQDALAIPLMPLAGGRG